jgi:hypothetical protein
MVRRSTLVHVCAVAALAAAIVFATTAVAIAAPAEPTLGLTALQAKLDASPAGTIPGYLKTVCKGATIETIPLDVLAITGGATADSSLILFEAKGPGIDKYGGIVAGMSGSPVYVDDGGVDKVIGALSYGDAFTIGGSGLATPIESMLKLTADYSPRIETLATPILTDGGVVDRVIVAPNPQDFKGADQAGAFVAKPLASVFIGGLRPNTKAYATLKAGLEKRGLSVVQLGAPLSGAGDPSFSTDLVGGASVTALATSGELWFGGLGTVTYVATDTLLAFGHPALWTGDSNMFMTNAWVDGIWPSQNAPYKIGRPTAVRGTFTQDRFAGIMGTIGTPPLETPVIAHVVDLDTGREASSAVHISRAMLDAGQLDFGVVGAAGSVAGYKLFDAASTPGSAYTTTTVRLFNGGKPYTVSVRNIVDDTYDIPSAVAQDADHAVSRLISVLKDGIETPQVLSVDVEAAVTRQHRSATIAGVNLYESLHEGENRVKVTMLAYGLAETQTVDTTLTIPAGVPLTGRITATCVNGGPGPDGQPPVSGAPERRTVQQIVHDLNTAPAMDDMIVTFTPSDAPSGDFPPVGSGVARTSRHATPWSLTGSAEVQISEIRAEAVPNVVPFGGSTMIIGEIHGPTKGVTVHVYGTPAGETTERLLATEEAVAEGGTVSFTARLERLTRNTGLRVHIDGGDGFTPADTYLDLTVSARILLTASARSVRYGRTVTVTALVAPNSCAGTNVVFEFYYPARRAWRYITTRTLAAGTPYAKARVSWKPPRGTWKVRARYVGGDTNGPSTSPGVNIAAR